ncbi:aldose 1-epimerase family protein [uncultured Jatrophihabitans sp.]|uniref:aldose 1-epimerase family protein n=1 Tax=uncultured Jatrophihabitans sp. TaxID=1610747 RepID=UPI0035CB0F94
MTGLGGETWTITSGPHRATIAEVGAGLRSYTHEGRDVTCRYGDDELPPKGCGTTLVPWPNRIRDGRYTFDGVEQQLALTEPDKRNAIHGLGRWARWSLVEQTSDSVRLGLDIVPQKGYPFQLHAEVEYVLEYARGLVVELSGRNDGSQRAPFGMGSHPYLSAQGASLDDVLLGVAADETFDVDDQQIPVRTRPIRDDEDFGGSSRLGARRFDQGFTSLVIEDSVPDDLYSMVHLSGAGFSSSIWFDSGFKYLQVYTVDEVSPGQPGVAFEPMTCAPNAFNSGDGLLVLEPGESWSGRWGIVAGRPL